MKYGATCLMLLLSTCAVVQADSLLQSDVVSSPASSYTMQVREKPPYPYKLRDTIMMNITIKDSLEFTSKLDTKRDLGWAARIKNFITHFGGENKSEMPNVEFEAKGQLKSDGKSKEEKNILFRIPAEIIDILPNGDLVLDAARTVQISDDTAVVRVGGVASPSNISPGKEIMSEWIKQLYIKTDSDGPLSDNRKRGFIIKFLEKFRLF